MWCTPSSAKAALCTASVVKCAHQRSASPWEHTCVSAARSGCTCVPSSPQTVLFNTTKNIATPSHYTWHYGSSLTAQRDMKAVLACVRLPSGGCQQRSSEVCSTWRNTFRVGRHHQPYTPYWHQVTVARYYTHSQQPVRYTSARRPVTGRRYKGLPPEKLLCLHSSFLPASSASAR